MNAETEIERLLEESGAVLVRQNKHLVYRLPNGKNFVAAKTSSDPDRAAKNNLSELRRALGVVRVTSNAKGDPEMPIEQSPAAVVAEPQLYAPEMPSEESFRERIEAAVAREEATQEKLLAEAQTVERRVHMLRALLAFADDPAIEGALRAVLPTAEPPTPANQPVPEPPQQITERAQVTRQLVFAATQTFDDTFTVNDVMALMTGGREINGQERQRIRSSIAQLVVSLHERGQLIKEAEGYGRRQTVWRRATLMGNNTRT